MSKTKKQVLFFSPSQLEEKFQKEIKEALKHNLGEPLKVEDIEKTVLRTLNYASKKNITCDKIDFVVVKAKNGYNIVPKIFSLLFCYRVVLP